MSVSLLVNGARIMNQNAAAIAFAALGVACVVLVVLLIVAVFFLITLQRALNLCAPRNRSMEPAMVWLNLIPMFNFYWNFHTVLQISNSLKREFVDRDLDD